MSFIINLFSYFTNICRTFGLRISFRARLVTKYGVKRFPVSTILCYIQVWQPQIIPYFWHLRSPTHMIFGFDPPRRICKSSMQRGVGIKEKIPLPLAKSPLFSISPAISERVLEEDSLCHCHSLSPAGLHCWVCPSLSPLPYLVSWPFSSLLKDVGKERFWRKEYNGEKTINSFQNTCSSRRMSIWPVSLFESSIF